MGRCRRKRQIMSKYWVNKDAHLATVNGEEVYVDIFRNETDVYMMKFHGGGEYLSGNKVLSVRPCDLKQESLEGIMKEDISTPEWDKTSTPITIINSSTFKD
jgi:hypothetical protein